MSETDAITGEVESTNEAAESDYTPPATQAELDKIIQNRIARTEAKYADYGDLKAAKSELDEIKKANQTEAEKAAEELESLRKAVAERDEKIAKAEFDAVRASVASDKGVPAAHLSGTTKEELESSADELIAWRDSQAKKAAITKPSTLKSGAAKATDDQVSAKERAARALRGE